MRKLTFNTRLLVMAIMLLTGIIMSKAEAAPLLPGSSGDTRDPNGVLYQRGGSFTAWSDADLTEWVPNKADYGTVMVNDVATPKVTRTADGDGLAFNSLGGKASAGFAANTAATVCHFTKTLTGSEVPAGNTLLTYKIVWAAGSPTGSANSTYSYVKMGDVVFRFYGQDKRTDVIIGSTTTTLANAGKTRNGTYTITVTVNRQSKVVTYIFEEGSKKDEGFGMSEAADFNTIEYGIGGKMPYWSISSSIVSISLTEDAAPASANYTVNFVDGNGVSLKEAETRAGTIGDAISLLPSDKTPFFTAEGTKYFYKSDDSEGKTVLADGSATVTVTYRQAEVYSYLARGVYEDHDLVFADGTVQEGESVKIYPPKYILLDGTTTLLTHSKSLEQTITPDADGYAAEVAYSVYKNNVVFFSEAENVNHLTKTIDDVYCKGRMSGGAGAFASGVKVAVASIPCGKYKMTAGAMGETELQFTANDEVILTASGSANTNVERTSGEFTLSERTIIYLEPGGSAGRTTSVAKAVDYLFVEQIEKGDCVDSGDEDLPDPETVPELRLVDGPVFKDISVRASARATYARPNPAGSTRKEGKPVVFYLGDSTTRNGSAGNGGIGGQWGWAFFAQEFIDSTKAVCENHALGGTSARTFYRTQWPNIKTGVKAGDFVVLGFGHNDGGNNWDTRSAISGYDPDETKQVTNSAGEQETVYTFGQYLRFFVNEIRALGATPVLCSMTARGSFNDDGTAALNTSHRAWTKAVAEEMGVSFIDLGLKAQKYYTEYGRWKVAQFFCNDGSLHTGLRGAWENAWYHALCIYEDESNPLHAYVVNPTQPKLDITRTAGQHYTFTVGGSETTSARDCYRSGDWHLVYNTIEKGDTVKMMFGKSELMSQVKDGELGCLEGSDDNLQNVTSLITNRHEFIGSYGWYIHYFANDVLEKGGVPVLVTSADAPVEIVKWNAEVAERLGIELQKENVSVADGTVEWPAGAKDLEFRVEKGEFYTVEVTYQGTLSTAYINSDLAGYTLGNSAKQTTETFTIPATRDFIDLHIADYVVNDATTVAGATQVKFMKQEKRQKRQKRVVRSIGDSTAAMKGSWAQRLGSIISTAYPELYKLCDFKSNGKAGSNLSTYYTAGRLASVLNELYPDDILMLGNMGTNGMGNSFEADVNYFLNAAEALGAKIILNSYTPHGVVTNYESGYNSETMTYDSYRKEKYDVIIHQIAEERAASDPDYIGFVEIGKHADAIFSAYVQDYAANGYVTADAAAAAINSCYTDHNHYDAGTLACDLMLNGYKTTDVKGIVAQLTELLGDNGGDVPETGITTLKAGHDTTAKVYDLQGRQVVRPVKGLYIVGGKKIVIK